MNNMQTIALDDAMRVRNVAELYEIWVFFALVDQIGVLLGQEAELELALTGEGGLAWSARACFGDAGLLAYNKYGSSYSVPLRPDYTWIRDGQAEVVLDAKFRLSPTALQSVEDQDTEEARVNRADLYKMHAYRDALGVRAAVAVYPGEAPVFYGTDGTKRDEFTLSDLLESGTSGIGALAMRPYGEEIA